SVARHDMTAKNKALLVSLRDAQALARLLGLAPKVMREVLSKPRMREAGAVRAQVAFAVALLLNAPARLGHLASLQLDRHLRRVGSGKEERVGPRVSSRGSEERPRSQLSAARLDEGASRSLSQPHPAEARQGLYEPVALPGRRPERERVRASQRAD